MDEKLIKFENRQFEKRWAYFLNKVDNPEQYMKGEIKEACRLFYRIVVNWDEEIRRENEKLKNLTADIE